MLRTTGQGAQGPARTSFWTLTLGSVGVVYGDIGTSPLYALKESLTAASAGGALTPEMVFGVVSLVLWALIIIVTLKYVLLILRMDNNGEGGTLTLMALVQRVMGRRGVLITALGMVGAALFYGDAIITPAISVLSAVEGLKLLSPAFEPFVLPLSLAILVALFVVQSWGTAAVAAWFGPITAVWFIAMALGGLIHLADEPGILAAISPVHGVRFLLNHGSAGLFALGAVFLAVTGAEALYADMGHFGRRPIQTAWLGLVFPSLVLNYLGQGALLLAHPEKLENPFYLLYPAWALLPMVVLASMATIIASQAVITGAFSLTQQAIQLGFLPRFEIRRTSETEKGQIYISQINWLLLAAVIALVVTFASSSALAAAYGIAVTGTMVVTAILAFFVLWKCWNWSPVASALVIAPFLAVDVVFLLANLLKVHEGGWMPLLVGSVLLVVMLTWRRGARILAEKAHREEVPLTEFAATMAKRSPGRVDGTAIFLTGSPDNVPSALLHNLKHNRVLHRRNVVLSVVTEDTPRVEDASRAEVEHLTDDFSRVILRFGFMETPNVLKALLACQALGPNFDPMRSSFFLSRRALRPAERSAMPRWQDKLFIGLARQASDVSDHFGIPSDRAVEVGAQVTV
jgi:KUP system potassium uptake protein